MSSALLHCFVTLQDKPLGLAKVVAVEGETARIEWFRSISEHLSTKPLQREVETRLLTLATPPLQTRCYVELPEGKWVVGRITGGDAHVIRVKVGGGDEEEFPVDQVWVRCLLPGSNPVETLAQRANDTPFFHVRRSAFMRAVNHHRSVAQGLTGLLSAPIRLLKHQVDAVRQVQEDPVCRYWLADDAGLGKTIEAGIVMRQLRCDLPTARILVVVPDAQKAQWRSELEEKLGLAVDGQKLVLLSTREVEAFGGKSNFDLVVLDEAHHIVAARHSHTNVALWERCREWAHTSPRVLLLSALPALHHEADVLALLHLLEPQSYALDDVEALKRQIQTRQEEGHPLAGEIHRIHQRLIRTSRQALQANALAHLDELSPIGATFEWDFDPRLEALHHVLEQWRTGATAYLASLKKAKVAATQQALFAEIYAILAQSMGTWEELLRLAVRYRLGAEASEDETFVAAFDAQTRAHLRGCPLFPGESETLQAIMGQLDVVPTDYSQSGQNALDVLVSSVDQLWRVAQRQSRTARIVVFTSSTLAGTTIAQRLGDLNFYGARVWSHLESDDEAAREANAVEFRTEPGPSVLVCDQSGEAGLHFQFADALLQFDLPWEPKRLEKRLRSIDCIGRNPALKHRVFVGWSGNDNEANSIHEAWSRVLEQGFDLWQASIAGLQFYIDAELPRIKRIALERGPQGLDELIPSIQESIDQERAKLREQAELDAFGQPEGDEFFLNLQRTDADMRDLSQALHDWLVGAWHFRYDREVQLPLQKFYATPETLVPQDWCEDLLKAQSAFPGSEGVSTLSRKLAVETPNVQLLRPGADLIEELHRLSRWDDRGQAFAIWRYLPNWRRPNALVFWFDVLIEIDDAPLKSALKELKGNGWSNTSQHALLRQAEAWAPPQWLSLPFDVEGEPLRDEVVKEQLRMPYKDLANGRDFNLDNERYWALKSIFPPAKWRPACEQVKVSMLKQVRSSVKLREKWAQSAAQARQEQEKRQERIRHAVAQREKHAFQTVSASEVEARLQDENRVFEALYQGMTTRSLRVDAVGFYVISNDNPFEHTR